MEVLSALKVITPVAGADAVNKTYADGLGGGGGGDTFFDGGSAVSTYAPHNRNINGGGAT